MKKISQVLTLALVASFTLGSCSVFRSDTDSKNPLIAGQAQRVNELESQLSDQKRLIDSEEAKKKALEYQLKSAKQELKARKQQAKVTY